MNKEEFKSSPPKPILSIRKKKQRKEKQFLRTITEFDLPITEVPLSNYKIFHSSLCDLTLPPVSYLHSRMLVLLCSWA